MRYTIQYGKSPDAPQTVATLHTMGTRTVEGACDQLATALQGLFTRRTLFRTHRPTVHIVPAYGCDDAGFFHIEHRRHNVFGQWWAEQGDNE